MLFEAPSCLEFHISAFLICSEMSVVHRCVWIDFVLISLLKQCETVHSSIQVYAWGDNDHGQQGNGTTTVNRKPALVQGLEGYKITRVSCGSSHSVAWATTDLSTPVSHEPVLFSAAKDPLGATLLGKESVRV